MSNDEMIRYWNEGAGAAWIAHQERLDAQLGPLGALVRERAEPAEGESVLDVGCGCGGTTLELAEAVGAAGRVVALDISGPMLERARQRAREAGLDARIDFRLDDAQHAPLESAGADVVFSRFGVMFFADSVAAFANLRRALRTDGRLAFVCWQGRERNPWMTAPALAAAQHVPFPPPPPPDAPGPFAFADRDRVRGILESAGFARVAFEPFEAPMALGGGDVDGVVQLMLEIGPVGAALREAKTGEDQRARVLSAVRGALEGFVTPRGLEAPAAAWIVTARNPG